ncbi:8799_t:CDS:2 [Funneliformis mosseae]|uniref:8799_t:CDS:1 n=1 Tax=Funneliformis mosseae TaxID=27381 RepID=A0A9N8ZDJ7_FUNMO|nr:8799_t:CDS:2 [Funneliformis mosseae]
MFSTIFCYLEYFSHSEYKLKLRKIPYLFTRSTNIMLDIILGEENTFPINFNTKKTLSTSREPGRIS